MIPSLSVREHKAYVKPEIYGTITGDAFKSTAGGGMRDGGMNWGGGLTTKKTEKKAEEGKRGDVGKVEIAKVGGSIRCELTTRPMQSLGRSRPRGQRPKRSRRKRQCL
jgi:hypothetical protein